MINPVAGAIVDAIIAAKYENQWLDNNVDCGICKLKQCIIENVYIVY